MSSSTVHLENVMTTLVIDAYEGRGVCTLDVAGALLLSKIPEFILTIIDGKGVTIMCDANWRATRLTHQLPTAQSTRVVGWSSLHENVS